METLEKPQPRGRLSTAPMYWPNGTLKTIRPTARDRNHLWPILQRLQMAPANYIHALMGEHGGNSEFFCDRLGAMAAEPNLYLKKPVKQKNNGKFRSRYLVCALTDTRIGTNFFHDLMANMIAAQIELACRSEGLDYITFDRILPGAPPERQAAKRPYTFEVTWEAFKGRDKTSEITADWPPFAIGRNGNYVFFNGVEADCDTETDEPHAENPARMDHATIERKLREYLAILDQEIIEKELGIPGPVFIPFVTTNPNNIATWQRLALKLTDGVGHPNILFRYMPSYNDDVALPPPPDGKWALGAWKRAAGIHASWTEEFYIGQL